MSRLVDVVTGAGGAVLGFHRAQPLVLRWVVASVVSFGAVGAVVGLVVGLSSYVPTAPFAAVEVGAPSAVLGGVVGLVLGGVAHRRDRHRRPASSRPARG